MPEIILSEKDNLDWALKKFRRQLVRSGLFRELKRRRHYEKPSDARRRKAKAARRRARSRKLKRYR
jgi:small subunit ribosomal protein S21